MRRNITVGELEAKAKAFAEEALSSDDAVLRDKVSYETVGELIRLHEESFKYQQRVVENLMIALDVEFGVSGKPAVYGVEGMDHNNRRFERVFGAVPRECLVSKPSPIPEPCLEKAVACVLEEFLHLYKAGQDGREVSTSRLDEFTPLAIDVLECLDGFAGDPGLMELIAKTGDAMEALRNEAIREALE
jgi:hypothetical protein